MHARREEPIFPHFVAVCYNLAWGESELRWAEAQKVLPRVIPNTWRELLASFSAEFGSRRASSLDLALECLHGVARGGVAFLRALRTDGCALGYPCIRSGW